MLRGRGVSLWDEGDGLRYRAPRGALTAELLDELRRRKDEVVRFLVAARRAASATLPELRPLDATGGDAPLSSAQAGLWFLYQRDAETGGPGVAYNISLTLRLLGSLDRGALARSLAEIVRRHTILRTTIVARGEEVGQRVGAAPAEVLAVVDLAARAGDRRDAEQRRLVSDAAERPFDLSAGPLFRFLLLRLGAEDHVLVSVLHHMVGDGWSVGILVRELSALYAAFSAGRPSPLAEPALQYADYAVHQRQWLAGPNVDLSLEYWKHHLAGAPPVLDLPTDRPRPVQQSYRGGLVRFQLAPEQSLRLKRLGQRHEASLFMTFVAAYATLLHRYSEQTDIVIGSPVANRHRREIEPLIGFFSSYLPLRVDLTGDPTFREVLDRVRRVTLDAYEHQQVPFEKLVEALRPPRSLGVTPVFQVALVLQNLPATTLALPGLAVHSLETDRASAKLDLSLLLEEDGDTIRGELEYCADLFEAGTIERMSRHFVALLDAVAHDPDRPISAVPLLADAERGRLLSDFSGARAETRAGRVVHERFEEQVARASGAAAVVCGDERLSYGELSARSSRLAHHLIAAGVAAESRVGVCLPRSVDLVVAMLAVLKAGGAYVPLDPSHPRERLGAIVDGAGIEVLVTVDALAPRLPETSGPRVRLDRDGRAIDARPAHPPRTPTAPEQLAYVIYTSGSTGRPKGVMVEHRSVSALVDALAARVYGHEGGGLRVALVAAVVFDASVQQIFGCLLQGHTLYVVDDESRRDGSRLRHFLRAHAIEVADGTPSLLSMLVESGLGSEPDLALRHLLVGGEALPAHLIEALHRQDRAGRIAITNLYGPTECGVDDTAFTVAPGERVAGSVVPLGTPLPNARVYILDRRREPVPVGVRGDIGIAGPCLGRGYLGDPGLTAQAWVPHPFVAGERLYLTGDRGRFTPDGQIEFLGRSDEQIKIRGYRIELGEIETALRDHPRVHDTLVLADRMPTGGGRLVAYVVPADRAPTVAELRAHLAARLPDYMIPAAFLTLARLPLNSSGKLDRAAVPRAEEADELDRGVRYVAPRDERERALAAVWASVLGRDRIGAEDHFFALGGDSIKALQVAARLRPQGLRLDIRDVFLHPTIETLAPHLTAVRDAIPDEAVGGDVPLTPVQTWFLREAPGAKHHFLQAMLLAPRDRLDPEALRRAVAKLQEHHDALRMRFRLRDGGVVQESAGLDHPVHVEIVDLRQASDPAPDLARHAAALQAGMDLEHGPLFRCALYRWPAEDRLLLAAHHLIVDAVSWRILLEDLEALYRQAGAGRPLALPAKTDSFQRWAHGVRAFANGRAREERAYWQRIEDADVGMLPVDFPAETGRHRDRVEHHVVLSEERTRALLTDAHRAYNTRIDDLLLVALARATGRFTGAPKTSVLLERHGREPFGDGADVARTVGWFTVRHPLVLDLSGPADLGRQIKVVKETLRATPHGGIGYEALRYVATPAAGFRLAPQIAFNYLGQLGRETESALWRWVDEDIGPSIDPEAPLGQELEIVGMVVADRLRLALGYSHRRFRDATIARLADDLETELAEILDHVGGRQDTELTPSDIDYDGFDVDGLDAFMKNLSQSGGGP